MLLEISELQIIMKIFVQLVLIQLLFDYLDYNFLCHIFAWNKISIKKKICKDCLAVFGTRFDDK